LRLEQEKQKKGGREAGKLERKDREARGKTVKRKWQYSGTGNRKGSM